MPAPDLDLQSVQLSALLHDVGKLFQRSGLRPSARFDLFTTADFGAHGAHAKWSADFVERHVSPRWPLRPHDVLTHHLPTPPSRTGRLVALADRMAAGEREREEEAESPSPWETQLLSIFSRIALDPPHQAPEGYYPLAPLALERSSLFPREGRLPPQECRRGYLTLWQGFEREFARLQRPDFEGFLEGAYHLLQRFCWCVPSAAYRQTPDVSLFDHSRLTCAVAACLHLEQLPEARLEALLARRGEERGRPLLLLVGGDLSGLQQFLYTVAAKGAARTLRGRSFYLQLLAESAARFLLRGLGLSTPNLLYSGGGHFYLLAPASATGSLESLLAELEQRILDLHRGDLGLSVGWASLSMEDFQGARFAQKWGEVAARVGEAKNRRFGRVLRHSYEALFEPAGAGGEGRGCEACHAELPAPREEEPRCPTCHTMEELGERLAAAAREEGSLLSLGYRRPDRPLSHWQEMLGSFGTWWEFGAGTPESMRYRVNDTDFTAAGAEGFRWMPAVIPWEARGESLRQKDFDGLARDSVGIQRLGVLRMDLDNLGTLFARGLGSSATASRVAALSSALRIFFEGWINRLCREVEADRRMLPPGEEPGPGRLYGVYSGGDDLFAIGSWDRIPLLARRIREDLGEFAVGNRAVHISSGIALVDPHLPVYQMARQAGEALEDGSKEHRRREGPDKDAVTLLGETLGWEEFDPVAAQVEELVWLVSPQPQGGGVPRSLLSLLGALHGLYRREAARQAPDGKVDPQRLYYGRWTWLAAYGLTRARNRARGQEAAAALARLQGRLAEPEAIRHLGLVARWAEYLTRSKGVERE